MAKDKPYHQPLKRYKYASSSKNITSNCRYMVKISEIQKFAI